MTLSNTLKRSLLFVAASFVLAGIAGAQTTAFTYQGKLTHGGMAANSSYDMEFRLFDTATAGSQIGDSQTKTSVQVVNGVFTVVLDFGTEFPGADRFLEISIRPAGSGTFTTLTPRQQVTSAPRSVRSLNAASADSMSTACNLCITDSHIQSIAGSKITGSVANADNATTAGTATNATQLGGINADQYVQTNDTRLSDARNPLPGSTNYIQNTTSLQHPSNFNISGNGAIHGNLGIGVENPVFRLYVAENSSGTGAFFYNGGGGTAAEGVSGTASGYLGYGGAEGVRGTGHTGVMGFSSVPFGRGVFGRATDTTSGANGVQGESQSPGGAGILGINHSGAGTGVRGVSNNGEAGRFDGRLKVTGRSTFDDNVGIGGGADPFNRLRVSANSPQPSAYFENTGTGVAVRGQGVNALGSLGGSNTGVSGQANIDSASIGVGGSSTDGTGVSGESLNGTGIKGWSLNGEAGRFEGRLKVTGNSIFDSNVGIGTTTPAARLHVQGGGIRVAGGNIFIAQPNSLIITSPNGNCWFITVSDTGVLSTISTPCP